MVYAEHRPESIIYIEHREVEKESVLEQERVDCLIFLSIFENGYYNLVKRLLKT